MLSTMIRRVASGRLAGELGGGNGGSPTEQDAPDNTTEAFGAALVLEGAVGIENPLSNRERGGLYSQIIGMAVGVWLLLLAPHAGELFGGGDDEIQTTAAITSVREVTNRDDDHGTRTSYYPTVRFVDAQTGNAYVFESNVGYGQSPDIGDEVNVAYAPNNPGGAMQVSSWGKYVAPGIRIFALVLLAGCAITALLRIAALFVGIRLLRKSRAERRAAGDTRSTFAVLRDEAGTHVSPRAIGAMIAAHSLFGLERPGDGENSRLGIFGTLGLGVLFALLIPLGFFIATQTGYVGDNLTAQGVVVRADNFESVIQYEDPSGDTWQLVDRTSKTRAVGNEVLVTFAADQPDRAFIVQRGAGLWLWFFVGLGVVGVLAMVPRFVFQLLALVVGVAMIVRPRSG